MFLSLILQDRKLLLLNTVHQSHSFTFNFIDNVFIDTVNVDLLVVFYVIKFNSIWITDAVEQVLCTFSLSLVFFQYTLFSSFQMYSLVDVCSSVNLRSPVPIRVPFAVV
uniref:Uncharacterized protein n=1 Tax=Ixodes ricinus TaxID=34613 RepID=A0A147BCD7_IXORI